MNLFEYQAKRLLSASGIETPNRHLARSENDVAEALDILEFPLYFKAQVLAGGRGKTGGVRRVSNNGEAALAFREIRSMVVRNAQTGPDGLAVDSVLIEAARAVVAELYVAIVIDRSAACASLIVSRRGGTDIETIAATDPGSILRVPLDTISGPTDRDCRQVYDFIDQAAIDRKHLESFVQSLYKAFAVSDALLLEVNPVGVAPDGTLVALDAKMTLDDSALFRHPEWADFENQARGSGPEAEAARNGLNYVRIRGGAIGCMVNGAGLAMATMDAITMHGGTPANFLDVGGAVTVEAATAAFRILTSESDIRVILVNIFGGIVKCDVIAEGIIAACKEAEVTIPVVVRLEGTNAEAGLSQIKERGRSIVVAAGLKEAVETAVLLSKGSHVNSR